MFPEPKYNVLSQNVHIAEVPKVKVIVEKFSKFQRDNVELRRLDEKVVCVEYDIFDKKSKSNINKPIQTMRAFFSIKPLYKQEGTGTFSLLPALKFVIRFLLIFLLFSLCLVHFNLI